MSLPMWMLRPRPRLLDYEPAAAAWALRRINTAYSGSCIRLRRTSDNAEIDVGFSGDALDIAAIESHCSGTNGAVVTWYSQHGGSGCDITQATAANQPLICSSGAVITQGGRPTTQWDSTDVLRPTSSSAALDIFRNVAYGEAMYVVRNTEASARRDVFLWTVGTNNNARLVAVYNFSSARMAASSRRADADAATTTTGGGGVAVSALGVFAVVRNWGGGTQELRENGVSLATTTGLATGSTSDTASSPTASGVGRHATNAAPEYISELVFYNRDVAATRARREYDVKTYYGIA